MPAYLSAFPHLFGRDVNPYIIHQKVWEAYPGHATGSQTPFLFSIQEDDGQVYVRSQGLPQWPTDGVRIKQERTLYPQRSILAIEVLLNPTKRSHHEVVLVNKADVAAFAHHVLEGNGVQILMGENGMGEDVPQIFLRSLSGKPIQREGGKPIPFHLWRCNAYVQVTHSEIFEKALVSGVGRKKAFGAGMILVRECRGIL